MLWPCGHSKGLMDEQHVIHGDHGTLSANPDVALKLYGALQELPIGGDLSNPSSGLTDIEYPFRTWRKMCTAFTSTCWFPYPWQT